jgi:hypothetical protein
LKNLQSLLAQQQADAERKQELTKKIPRQKRRRAIDCEVILLHTKTRLLEEETSSFLMY